MVVDGEGAQHRGRLLLALLEVGLPADEVRRLHLRALHAGLDDGPLGVELVAVGAVALLQPTRWWRRRRCRPAPRRAPPPPRGAATRASRRARTAGAAPSPARRRRRSGRRAPASESDLDLPAGAEAEALVADVVAGELAEDVAGPRPPEADRGVRRRQVDHDRRAVVRHPVGEPLAVDHAVRAAGDHPEPVVGQPHHGEVGAEAAARVEHRGVDHPPDRHVGLGDDDAAARRRGRRGRRRRRSRTPTGRRCRPGHASPGARR